MAFKNLIPQPNKEQQFLNVIHTLESVSCFASSLRLPFELSLGTIISVNVTLLTRNVHVSHAAEHYSCLLANILAHFLKRPIHAYGKPSVYMTGGSNEKDRRPRYQPVRKQIYTHKNDLSNLTEICLFCVFCEKMYRILTNRTHFLWNSIFNFFYAYLISQTHSHTNF